ncbi:ABC transporter substrate-binding protein [Romboutsia sp. CE17]|uniref:ABC transporter substrate-binding protein n=1 Tax=Romboutsia sp. CE17 TaxID=2724150 RepID=UPI001442D37E|nr:ABC transporter substrate-binding protein [Romboutsia sp. CE17]QJA09587.1 ABC transporter substrate-binding protein [Romboutsia sp. CE17]
MVLKKLKKIITLSLMVALTATALVGCTSSSSKESNSKSQVTNERKANNELIAAVTYEPEEGFDATESDHGDMTRVFFSTLFQRDKDLGMKNDLAESHEISEDRLTWTVKIREDVKFTDGEPLTAEDVVYTYEIAKNSGSSIDLTMLESVKQVDEYTIEFKLNNPQSTFIEKLARVGIVPKHVHNEGFADNPIGSGPYKFIQWDKGQQVIAEANEDYYGDVPSIKKLTMVFMDDDAAYAALKAGEIDIASIPGSFAKEEVEGKKLIELDSIETYGVAYPMEKPGKRTKDGNPIGNAVTSDEAIRKAMTYAIDREELVEGILEGYGAPSSTGLEKMPWLNEDTVIKPEEDGDIEGAKKILEEAGWKDTNNNGIIDKDGVEAEFSLLYTDGKYRQELGLAYVEVAKELGIKVNLEARTWDTIIPDINSQAVLYGFGSGDPSEIYNLYSSKTLGVGVPWNNSGYYKNSIVDKYIDQALQSESEDDALEYWKKAQWDGNTGFSPKGDCAYTWFVNAGHLYLADEDLDIGTPVVQPHGGRVLYNITEWKWK